MNSKCFTRIYTTEEKIQIIKWYYSGNTGKEIQVLFSESFDKRPVPSVTTILHTAHRFSTTGCLQKCAQCTNKGVLKVRKVSEKQKLKESKVCRFFEENPTYSAKQISKQTGINAVTIADILHRNGYKYYRVKSSAESKADFNNQRERLKFCDDILQMINSDKNFTQNILFSNEYCFTLNGHQCYSGGNYWMRDTNHLKINAPSWNDNQERLYVWVGILSDYVVGPFYIDKHLTDEEYLLMFRESIVPYIHSLNINIDKIWLQYDSSLSQNFNNLKLFLETTFSNQIIGKDGAISWPSSSTDLSPSNFFVLEYIKQEIYKSHIERVSNLNELKVKISEVLTKVTPVMLADVRQEFCKRVEKCKAQNGEEF